MGRNRILLIITVIALATLIGVSVFYLRKVNFWQASQGSMQQQLVSLQNQYDMQSSQKNDIEQQAATLENDKKGLQAKIDKLILDKANLEKQLIALSREKDNLEQNVTLLTDDNESLENQLGAAQVEQNELNKQIVLLNKTLEDVQDQLDKLRRRPARFIEVLTPNGGESLCLGEQIAIEWESNGVTAVTLSIVRYGMDRKTISSYPATFNSSEVGKGKVYWEVGKVEDGILDANYDYELGIYSDEGDISTYDNSDTLFVIEDCG